MNAPDFSLPEDSIPRDFPSRPLLMCVFACFAFLLTHSSFAQTWREVQSPHFHVVTDGTESDGRNVAKEFEQMRSVFAVRFGDGMQDGPPLTVFAVDEGDVKLLSPRLWKDHDRVAGEFFSKWEQQYAMVRLDAFGDLNQAVVFHEYAHSVLHANIHWLPIWLDEGMAEFYGYTRFQNNHIYLGAPSIRLKHLQYAPLLPISDMLTPTKNIWGSDEQTDVFYGEAWAMVHYMTFGEGMEGGAKLGKFLQLLEGGKKQPEAFQQVFGDTKPFEKKLSQYVLLHTMSALTLPQGEKIDEKSYSAKVLTKPEVDYYLGAFDAAIYDTEPGKKRLEAAVSANPKLAGAHEELGFLAWRDGKDDEAKAEWQKAVDADAGRYRASFALLMTGKPLKEQSPQQLVETQHALEVIMAKAPQFAPAYVEQALIAWRQGRMSDAYKLAHTAENLAPWRAGYHLLSGYILLQGRLPKVAANYATTVAAQWPGSDHDEAVDLWGLMPASARGDGTAPTLSMPEGATVVRGTIVSTACAKDAYTLVLQPQEKGAAPLTLTGKGPRETGFSDTLWFGEDHFTSCYHMAGLPALVAYKDAAGTHALSVLEFRDDLPAVTVTDK